MADYKSRCLPVTLSLSSSVRREEFGVSRRRFLLPLTAGRKSDQEQFNFLRDIIPICPFIPAADAITSRVHVFPVDAHWVVISAPAAGVSDPLPFGIPRADASPDTRKREIGEGVDNARGLSGGKLWGCGWKSRAR